MNAVEDIRLAAMQPQWPLRLRHWTRFIRIRWMYTIAPFELEGILHHLASIAKRQR